MRPSPRRLALLSILAAAGLAGCTRDLELPEPPTSPVISGFSPPAAFAGQIVRVTGAHFAEDATGNTVNFAFASARAERTAGGDLAVRVPPDAGTGPITVTNREGTSAASTEPFTYLGLGEPARLQVTSRSPILQRPRAVYAVGGDVILDSALYGGLVWADNSSFTTPTLDRSAADPDSGYVYFVHTDVMAGTQLSAMDGSRGILQATTFLPDVPHQILPLAGRNLLLTFHTNGLYEEVVAGWNATDLTQVFPPTPYGVGSFDGAADVRDGQAIVAGYDLGFDRFTLFRLDLRSAPTPPPAATEFACAIGYPGPCPPELGTASSGRVPLAVATSGGGTPRAVAALFGGNAVIANPSGTPPEFMMDIVTFSPEPIEALAGSRWSSVAVATKPEAGYAFAFSVDNGALRWSIEANRPTAVATIPQVTAMESTDLAFVAGAADNELQVVNSRTGLVVERINFDVGPRVEGYAAAYMDTGTGLDGDLIFPATAFPGLLRVPSGTGTPSVISRTPAIERLATSAGDGAIWQVSNGATPRLDGYLGYLGGVWDTAVSAVLPAAPQRLAARGALAAVAHDSGLSLVDGASPPAGTAPFADIPGFASPTFLGLGFTPSGDVWLVVTDFALTEAQLWAPGSIVPGGTPSATVAVMNGAHSAAWLEDGLWIFGTDGGGIPQATLIGGAFTELRTIPTSDRLGEVHAVSPNSRLLVCREFGGTLGYPLRFFLADPETGFPEVGSLIFTERIEGFTFDTKGERLYVLTQNPDRVITVD